MDELGELERHNEEFARRKVRIVAVSNDKQADAQKTQERFKHLSIVADTQQNLAKAMQVIHAGAAADGTDTNAPTTIIVDGDGAIRWTYRPGNVAVRLSSQEMLNAVDKAFP
jgi:peroxiredoxin